MKDTPDVIQSGLQHIHPVHELRVSRVESIQHFGRVWCWLNGQWHRIFDAEDARLRRALGA